MILISSAAYIDSEFSSEVGMLPPSFLPIGNKRLYELQVAWLRQNNSKQQIFLSLPKSFDIPRHDRQILCELDVHVIVIEDGLSIGESIVCSWNSAPQPFATLTILYGDTLFRGETPSSYDVISVHENSGYYDRAKKISATPQFEVVRCDNNDKVLSGFFKFSNPFLIMKNLVQGDYDFIECLNKYSIEKGINVYDSGTWLDFGHINAYFESRTKMTTERIFNELSISKRSVVKASSTNEHKIKAECFWFENIPMRLRSATPPLLSNGSTYAEKACYEIEYLYILPLNDLFVFGNLAFSRWKKIFSAMKELLELFYSYKSPIDLSETLESLYLNKTKERLSKFFNQQSEITASTIFVVEDEEFTLNQLAEEVSSLIGKPSSRNQTLSHGDFCFSNLLYDSRADKIVCIDPRGHLPNGEFSIYGDIRYDLAKLYHSIIGKYDQIIATRYELKMEDFNWEIKFNCENKLETEFENSFRENFLKPFGVGESEILAINVLLFISMIPLHSDNKERQFAFIANAIRLFKKVKKEI